MTISTTPWRETGNTTREAFAKAICRRYNGPEISPMCSEADRIYDAIAPHGLTRLAAAMSWHELKNDTYPSDYGVKPEFHNAWCMKKNGAWAVYPDYTAAAIDWVTRLLSTDGPYRNTKTLADLIHIYAPAWDSNDEVRYVEILVREIDALPLAEKGEVNKVEPVVHDIAVDYAKYGLDKGQATKIQGYRFLNRQGYKPMAIVLHIQEGTTPGSLGWWASGRASASATVMANRDGSILKVIPTEHGPWTNGDTAQPSAKGAALIRKIGNANPNLVTLSVEAEGYSNSGVTQAQHDAIVWQCRQWMSQFGLTVNDVYRHADINSVSRAFCPGVYYDAVVAELKDGATTTPPTPPTSAWPGKPAWLADSLVKELFPEATPTGPRTKAWLAYCAATGRAPRRIKFHLTGTDNEAIEFSDGLLIFKDGSLSTGGK